MYCALVMLQRVTFLALAINFCLAVPMYKSTPATCSRSLMPFVPLLNTIDIDDKKSPSIFELHLYFSQKDAFWLIVPMYKSTPVCKKRALFKGPWNANFKSFLVNSVKCSVLKISLIPQFQAFPRVHIYKVFF